MAKKVSTGKTIFKIGCATGGAILASGIGLPWLGAMAGSCLPKVLEGSLDFLVSAIDDDKKQEVLTNLLQKPIEQLASIGVNFSNDRIEGFLSSHFEAKDAELNFDLPRAVLKVWEEALNKMLFKKRKVIENNSTLGLNRNDQFEINRKELLTLWRQKIQKAQTDNDRLKELFGEKPDYFLEIIQGKKKFVDLLPDQDQVENFFWKRIENSFTTWAKNEEKFPEGWANSIHQSLKDELKHNLFHNFSSALKKELKENERAWKSFEFASSLQIVSMLQSLASNIDQIKDDTSDIKKDLAELNAFLPLIMRDMLTRFDKLENTVKEYFRSIQNINELLATFRDVNNKLNEIDKKIDSLPDKVVEQVIAKLPPVILSDTDEMDEIIVSSQLKALRYNVKTSSHRLISQLAEAKKLAKKISRSSLEEEFLFTLGLISFSLGEFDDSINFHEQAFELQNSDDFSLKIIANLCCIGNSFLLKGDTETALRKYQESIKLIELQNKNK